MTSPAVEEPDRGRVALEQLTAVIAAGAWTTLAILIFIALAIAAMLYAGNKRRGLEADDQPWR